MTPHCPDYPKLGWLSTDRTSGVQECCSLDGFSIIEPGETGILLKENQKCRFSADFAQVFSFSPDAFVAAPQAVETRALQPLGCHGEIKVAGFRMNSGNPKNCKLSGSKDYGIILSFLYGLEWIDMEAYVHTWACALVLHVSGLVFGGLV